MACLAEQLVRLMGLAGRDTAVLADACQSVRARSEGIR
jgi:hypothetical protein